MKGCSLQPFSFIDKIPIQVYNHGNRNDGGIGMTKNVTVYSTNTCPYCTKLKDFLDEQGIPYKDVNLQESPEVINKIVQETGQMGVPQTEIDGEWVVGFNPVRIMELVNR